jgi:hypothetical protein
LGSGAMFACRYVRRHRASQITFLNIYEPHKCIEY